MNGFHYETQERAFAPGISGEWPDVIPHPTNPHGRLVKKPGDRSAFADLLEACYLAFRELDFMIRNFPERRGGLYEQARDKCEAALKKAKGE